jgi:hypothetical protein
MTKVCNKCGSKEKMLTFACMKADFDVMIPEDTEEFHLCYNCAVDLQKWLEARK